MPVVSVLRHDGHPPLEKNFAIPKKEGRPVSVMIDERVAGGRPTRPVKYEIRRPALGRVFGLVTALLAK